MIRLANKGDVSQVLAIYRPYILNTCITFETEVPSEQAFLERFETITAHYPWIVWEENYICLFSARTGRIYLGWRGSLVAPEMSFRRKHVIIRRCCSGSNRKVNGDFV